MTVHTSGDVVLLHLPAGESATLVGSQVGLLRGVLAVAQGSLGKRGAIR